MPINASFDRPKLNRYTNEEITLYAEVEELPNEFIVDIVIQFMNDDNVVTNKTLFRVKLPFSINGSTIKINDDKYAFPGNAIDYSSGGNTPALTAGIKGSTIDLNQFLNLAGKLQSNQ